MNSKIKEEDEDFDIVTTEPETFTPAHMVELYAEMIEQGMFSELPNKVWDMVVESRPLEEIDQFLMEDAQAFADSFQDEEKAVASSNPRALQMALIGYLENLKEEVTKY